MVSFRAKFLDDVLLIGGKGDVDRLTCGYERYLLMEEFPDEINCSTKFNLYVDAEDDLSEKQEMLTCILRDVGDIFRSGLK